VIVWGDRKAISLVIDNLLENAWKFTRQTPEPCIEIGAAEEQGMDALYIKDNGVGFDMKYAAKLFRAFERLHDAKLFEGTGIGLATVRHIVERHGGKVSVEAAEGKGATFYVYLPTHGEHMEHDRRQTGAGVSGNGVIAE
jgi:signal transduction histidine kinase